MLHFFPYHSKSERASVVFPQSMSCVLKALLPRWSAIHHRPPVLGPGLSSVRSKTILVFCGRRSLVEPQKLSGLRGQEGLCEEGSLGSM